MSDIRSYYYFAGENIDGDWIDFSTTEAVTEVIAQSMAANVLEEVGGGHIDAWYAETDEWAFDVEV